MKIRKAAVAGKFYPAAKEELISLIRRVEFSEKRNINLGLAEKNIIGGIVPHAGYIFSAYQAVHFFKIISEQKEKYDTIFIINPNHTGLGDWISVEENTHWETPYGITKIDEDFTKLLDFPRNYSAHQYEHSGEVMLPLLQHYLKYEFDIFPITFGEQSYHNAKLLAEKIFKANKILKKRILIIASSDFSHFETVQEGFRKDQLVVDRILGQNVSEIERVIAENNISVCGYAPIMTVLEYAKLCSANPKIEMLARGHSGMVQEAKQVFDYISFLLFSNSPVYSEQ